MVGASGSSSWERSNRRPDGRSPPCSLRLCPTAPESTRPRSRAGRDREDHLGTGRPGRARPRPRAGVGEAGHSCRRSARLPCSRQRQARRCVACPRRHSRSPVRPLLRGHPGVPSAGRTGGAALENCRWPSAPSLFDCFASLVPDPAVLALECGEKCLSDIGNVCAHYPGVGPRGRDTSEKKPRDGLWGDRAASRRASKTRNPSPGTMPAF